MSQGGHLSLVGVGEATIYCDAVQLRVALQIRLLTSEGGVSSNCVGKLHVEILMHVVPACKYCQDGHGAMH